MTLLFFPPFFSVEKKKPSRFFMEQWHLARAQSPPDSPCCSPDTLRQVVAGMECDGDANTAQGRFGKLRRHN